FVFSARTSGTISAPVKSSQTFVRLATEVRRGLKQLLNSKPLQGGPMNPEMSYDAKPESAEAAPRNFFSRLIGVYFSPGETFAEMAKAPRSIAPIIAITLLFIISGVFVTSRVPFEKIGEDRIQQSIASGQMSEEQAERQREGLRRMAPIMKFLTPIFSLISVGLMVFGFAGLAKLVSMMMGIENRYMSLVS